MRHTALALAVLAPLATLAPVVHAADFTYNATPGTDAITVNFSGLTATGLQFFQMNGPFYGTLTSVSVNATLDASVDYTYADDLTLYVDPLPLSTGGLLQVGGFSNLSASERHAWANGGSSAPGTTVIDTVTLITPLTFNGSASNPAIWLGNGYNGGTNSGTWTGSITLNGLSVTPVPEPASWALFAAGSVGLMGWMGRRRKAAR